MPANRNRITILREQDNGKTIIAMANYRTRHDPLIYEALLDLDREGWVCDCWIPNADYHETRGVRSDAWGVLGDMVELALEAYDDVKAGR